MTNMRAVGHANITWRCPHCDKRNRTHVKLGGDVSTVLCEQCGAEADVFPTTVVVYEAPLLTTGEDAA